MPNNPYFDKFFEDFKTDSKIFADYHYLTPEFQPEELIDRKDQIEKIWNDLLYALKKNTIPQNFFLYGLPGTGKTATIQCILQKCNKWSKTENRVAPLLFYNNCAMNHTPYQILREICAKLKINLPRTGISMEDAFSRFLKATNRSKQVQLIIILDELDILFGNKKKANDLLYKLIRYPSSEHPSFKIAIIGITNDLTLRDLFDSRIKSSLNPEELYFAPYTAIELQNILYQRVKAFKPNVLEYGVIELIAAHFARDAGDARRAIAVLRTAGEIADKDGSAKVSKKHTELALRKFLEIQSEKIIKSLSTQSKKILEAIQTAQEKYNSPITGIIYREYLILCERSKYPVLGKRQFNNHVKDLEKLNLINIEPVFRGKGGNSRKITFYFT